MTKKERMELVDWNDGELSISEQAKLLGINRSSLYYKPVLPSAEEVAMKHRIDDIALAYRNNKKGKNNIDFAYEVFDFLLNQEQAIVISIDFKEFFDHINHAILKQNIKTVFDIEKLPKDWFKVFKNITQFSYVDKSDTEAFLKRKFGIKKQKELLKTGKLKKIMDSSELCAFKNDFHLYKPLALH
ncbi:hypothetical protein [Oceanobacillus timonensis]|uniref:hypothetical protein n=1 Tax=Oceanobacillus timonensis TaxID=1926285 RepID=UPI0009BABBEE|nr:hypothetical protein [Oceanobacillus timonensis]